MKRHIGGVHVIDEKAGLILLEQRNPLGWVLWACAVP